MGTPLSIEAVNENAKNICKRFNIDESTIQYMDDTSYNNYTAKFTITISEVKISVSLTEGDKNVLSFTLKDEHMESLGSKLGTVWPYITKLSKYKQGDNKTIYVSFKYGDLEKLIEGFKNILSDTGNSS